MELPRALAPWAAELMLLPFEVATSLGPWVRRLALAIGPLRAHRSSREGEPDGFDGIDRRGSFEHLLATDWLLADELPDEFLRRAAEGELSFVRPARREPAATVRSVALLDAGPAQVGAPRLAHLAMLVVLARRAAGAGVVFEWGTLQDAGRKLRSFESRGDVGDLLMARTWRDVEEADVDAWGEELRPSGAARAPGVDVWLIGAPYAHDLVRRSDSKLRGSSGAEVVERFEGDRAESERTPPARDVDRSSSQDPHLELRIWRDGPAAGGAQTAAPIRLALPEMRACVRLVRDPYGSARPPAAPDTPGFALERGLLFSESGQLLLVPLRNGGVLCRGIRAQGPRSVAVPEGETAIAAYASRRQIWVISSDERSVLRLRGGNDAAGRPIAMEAALAADPPGRLRSCFSDGNHLWFPDAHGRLFRIGLRQQEPRLELISIDHACVVRLRDQFYSLQWEASGLAWRRASATARFPPWSRQRYHSFDDADRAAACGPFLSWDRAWPTAAVPRSNGGFEIRTPETQASVLLRVPETFAVAGLVGMGLVCVADSRTVVNIEGTRVSEIHRAPAEIAAVACCAMEPWVAVATVDERIRVVFMRGGHELLDFGGDAS